MLHSILSSAEAATAAITVGELLACTAASLILGLLATFIYMYKNAYSKSFVVTLAILPSIIQLVIMMVNGNLGAGVAVMGAFSLVRFRSAAGTAREICAIFLAMALGLATGMGFITIAAIFLVIIGAVTLLLTSSPLGEHQHADRRLKIIIPEDLDYSDIFDDLFQAYTKKAELIRVKTTNMGSLFELQYNITLKDSKAEKSFIDEIRCRNGNLNIVCSRLPSGGSEL